MTSGTVLLSLLLATSAAAAPRSHRYVVSIPEGAQRAHVEAQLWLPSPAVSLFGVVSAKGLPNGQAELLENLRATDAQGRALGVENLGDGDWRLTGQGAVRLSYDVRLEHDQYEWEAGVEEVAYHAPDGLMATGSALFVAPTESSTAPPRRRWPSTAKHSVRGPPPCSASATWTAAAPRRAGTWSCTRSYRWATRG